MKEIKIEGLNDEQIWMLDIMWSIESTEELEEWLETLEADQIRTVLTLKEVLLAHCFDQVTDTKIADDYLKKFRL